jgi:HAD superfamily hydrolase (TIGR01450 family)
VGESQGYLIDLDGTLMSGRIALPGAAQLLEQVGERFVIVSNDAEHVPGQLAGRLRAAGLRVPEERIVLAGTTALDLLAAEQPRARVMLIAGAALRRYARHLGLQPASERADVVVLGRDRGFNYAKLTQAANAVRAGAKLVVANPDETHPGPAGDVVPETGALAAAVLACTGPVPHRVIGKPQPALFLKGLALLGIEPHACIVIGDNPRTDGAGAARLGLRYLQARPDVPLRLDSTESARGDDERSGRQLAL